METIDFHAADNTVPKDTYHLEFSKSREIGPGRMSSHTPLKSIELKVGEIFGEETTALYVPSREWLLVLNNHYGVGPSKMAAYFNDLDPGNLARFFDYVIEPMIDRSALSRMKRMRRFAEVEISAKAGVFGELDDGVSESVYDAAGKANAVRLSLKLIANEKHKHGNSLNPTVVRNLIKKMLPHSEDIDKLVIKADDEDLETKDKVVDLLKHKMFVTFSEKELEVSGGRYTPRSKISLLRRACRGWLKTIN